LIQPPDANFEARVRASFARQAVMRTLGATIERVAPGEVELALPFREQLTQQHGFLHAGIITAVADSACGYAALSLMEPGAGVLSVEFKIQLLSPAKGARFLALGRVIRAGRTLTVVAGEVRTESGEVIALLNGTMMSVRDRPGLTD
jgi:uncharacterized protein (TIGR00369 family)